MVIRWSEDDKTFIVMLPEFEDALTHGDTYEEAVHQGKTLIESFILWYRQDGKPLPTPLQFEAETQKLVAVSDEA